EVTCFFEDRLCPLLNKVLRGPWGCYLDLQGDLPLSLVEIKFLLRLFCRSEGFFLSRVIIEQAGQALLRGSANQRFEMGQQKVVIDRHRIFILSASPDAKMEAIAITMGSFRFGGWKIEISEENFVGSLSMTSWKEGWVGNLICFLPKKRYVMSWEVGLIERPL